MSTIVLTFHDYQSIRDAMAFARGQLQALSAPAPPPGFTSLESASELLESARWRTEDGAPVTRVLVVPDLPERQK